MSAKIVPCRREFGSPLAYAAALYWLPAAI